MGHGGYSTLLRSARASSSGYHTLSAQEIFKNKTMVPEMDPKNVIYRESRDSSDHPNSLPIILSLDLTGSMGSVPSELIKDGLPKIVSTIIQSGIPDPQILFIGVGDHTCDKCPLQVGQFESSDEKLDYWLTNIYMERGGGGNEGESYLLSHYFAAYHTKSDSFEKRNKKGYLFTIGDEPTLEFLDNRYLKGIISTQNEKDYSCSELIEESKKFYNVYHIHLKETGRGQRPDSIFQWSKLLNENLIACESHKQIPNIIADTIIKNEKQTFTEKITPKENLNDKKEEIVL